MTVEIEHAGEYRVVCAHLEPRRSPHTGRRYTMATLVVIQGDKAGAILHAPLVPMGDATWVWESAADSIEDLLGTTFLTEVRAESYQDQRRWRAGRLIPEEED